MTTIKVYFLTAISTKTTSAQWENNVNDHTKAISSIHSQILLTGIEGGVLTSVRRICLKKIDSHAHSWYSTASGPIAFWKIWRIYMKMSSSGSLMCSCNIHLRNIQHSWWKSASLKFYNHHRIAQVNWFFYFSCYSFSHIFFFTVWNKQFRNNADQQS